MAINSSTLKRRIPLLCVLLAALALLAFLLLPAQSKGIHQSYADFSAAIDQGRIEHVLITDDYIEYSYTDDDALYQTENPNAANLRERLLLANVDLEQSQDSGATLNALIDAAFVLIFFAVVGGGLYKLLEYRTKTFKVVRSTGVTFDDVAGMNEVKAEMKNLVEVLKDPMRFATAGIRPVKGVVLEGPPGNGKTLFAKALAQEAGVKFIATKGADFQSAFMSLGARKIKELFSKAARHKPCIVFIDEFDSIGERRNYAGTGVDKENNRIITAMLNEMDGFAGNDGVLVVAATNSYRSLDPALIRPGRFDLKFTIDNPDQATREQLVKLYTKNRTLAPNLTYAHIAELFEGQSAAAVETCLNIAAGMVLGDGGTIDEETIRQAAQKADISLR